MQAWVYAVLLWVRGRQEERLSDRLLGWVLVALAFEIWMYMLGFGGIEIFWQRLEFFPRTLTFLLPPLIYFYLRAQFDVGFRFRPHDVWHALPFMVDALYHLIVFALGPTFVQYWEANVHNRGINHLEYFGGEVQQFLYMYWSFQLYRAYRAWTKTQFSDTEQVSFRWFRNFLIALLITIAVNLIVTLIDLWLNLDFWHDWWGDLVTVVLIYYVSIHGYAQVQSGRQLTFSIPALPAPVADLPLVPVVVEPELEVVAYAAVRPSAKEPLGIPDELRPLRDRLLAYMTSEKPYLEPELSLANLSRRLHTNPVVLSQVINTGAGKNFNDFVNQYRVDEFKRQVRNPANAHLSFLGLALDCGFNSKATFNRAFRKFTGQSPGGFLAGAE